MTALATPRPTRRRRRAGPVLALVAVALIAARLWLWFAYDARSLNGADEGLLDQLIIAGTFAAYLVVGLLLVQRRPDNRVAWVLSAIGILTTAGSLAENYALVALADGGRADLPGAVFAAWIFNWYWYPLLALIVLFVPMLFPTGRPLTPRWNWLFYAANVLLILITLLAWTNPTLTDGSLRDPSYVIDNPIGLPLFGDIEESAAGAVLFAGIFLLAICAVVSLVLRFRRSAGVERQQMKLFLFAAAVMAAEPIADAFGLQKSLPDVLSHAFFIIAVGLPPLAIGVAVLRYRLYDIDRLISRTVSYAVLTAFLLSLYLAVVATLSSLGTGVTGDSPLGVAAATLLAAAAFGPARRRIQDAVDRRFNRARYSAALTIEAYRTRARDQVDPSRLTDDLLGAVQDSVQPSCVALWLRDATAVSGSGTP